MQKIPKKTRRLPSAAAVSFDSDKLLSRREAAEILGRSQKFLRQAACNRAGPRCIKFGSKQQSRVFYRRSDLEAWVLKAGHAIGDDA